MRHAELLLVPILMFADHFLTLVSEVLKEKQYAKHFTAEHHELNPIWQADVHQRKWFNLKQILLTCVISLILAFLVEFGEMSEPIVQGLLGCFLVRTSALVGKHLYCLMVFQYVIRRPDEISGQVQTAHRFLLVTSACQYAVVLIPLLLVAVFAPSAFAVGGLIGIALSLSSHLRWLRKYDKKKRQAGATNTRDPNSQIYMAS